METLAKRGDEPGFRAASADATARFRALGDGWGLSAVLYHRGWALSRFGHHAEAVPVLEEAIEVASRAGVHNTAQWATADLGLGAAVVGPRRRGFRVFRPRGQRLRPGRRRRRTGPGYLRGRGARPTSRRPHDGASHCSTAPTTRFSDSACDLRPDWRWPAGRPAMSGRVICPPPATAMPRWSRSGNPLARLVWSQLVWRAWPELLRPTTIRRVPPNCSDAPAGCGRPTTGRARPRSKPTPRGQLPPHDQCSMPRPMRRPRNAAPRPAYMLPAKVVPAGHPPRSPVRSA